MTRAQMEKLVSIWQSRLGLDSWDIAVDWSVPASENADADAWRSDDYDRAKIRFDVEYKKWVPVFANRIVVHELLHLLTRDIDRVIGDIEGEISRDVFAQTNKRYDHEIEGLVDRLSYRFVELTGPNQ